MSVTHSPIPQVRGISRRRLLGYVGVGLVTSLMNPLSGCFRGINPNLATEFGKIHVGLPSTDRKTSA